MKRLLFLVEGQTEESVVQRVLAPHLETHGVQCQPIILNTRRLPDGHFRGGLGSWKKVEDDLKRLLPDPGWVTTLFDFYGLPADFPGRAHTGPKLPPRKEAERLEAELLAAFPRARRFIPFLALHELEAWLFADPLKVEEHVGRPRVARELTKAVRHGGPEAINHGPGTHPSKRLEAAVPEWKKRTDGPLVLEAIGIERIRAQCPHFAQWLARLEALG